MFFAVLIGTCQIMVSQSAMVPAKDKKEFCKKQVFKRQSIYIVTRGTVSKRFVIANEFNLADTNSTHVGIGYKDKNTNKIVNVTNNRSTKNNALVTETFDEFLKEDDVTSCAIYKIKISKSEYRKFREIIKQIESMAIVFDYEFSLTNSDSLYCSEFCYQVLKQIDSTIFRIPFVRKKITNSFIKTALKREYLNYIPVDFYLYLNRETKLTVSKTFRKNDHL